MAAPESDGDSLSVETEALTTTTPSGLRVYAYHLMPGTAYVVPFRVNNTAQNPSNTTGVMQTVVDHHLQENAVLNVVAATATTYQIIAKLTFSSATSSLLDTSTAQELGITNFQASTLVPAAVGANTSSLTHAVPSVAPHFVNTVLFEIDFAGNLKKIYGLTSGGHSKVASMIITDVFRSIFQPIPDPLSGPVTRTETDVDGNMYKMTYAFSALSSTQTLIKATQGAMPVLNAADRNLAAPSTLQIKVSNQNSKDVVWNNASGLPASGKLTTSDTVTDPSAMTVATAAVDNQSFWVHAEGSAFTAADLPFYGELLDPAAIKKAAKDALNTSEASRDLAGWFSGTTIVKKGVRQYLVSVPAAEAGQTPAVINAAVTGVSKLVRENPKLVASCVTEVNAYPAAAIKVSILIGAIATQGTTEAQAGLNQIYNRAGPKSSGFLKR